MALSKFCVSMPDMGAGGAAAGALCAASGGLDSEQELIIVMARSTPGSFFTWKFLLFCTVAAPGRGRGLRPPAAFRITECTAGAKLTDSVANGKLPCILSVFPFQWHPRRTERISR